MTLALDILVRTSAVLLAGLALRAILSRRSAAVRHIVLAAAMAGAAAVVPLSFVAPAWTIELPSFARAREEPTRPALAPAPRTIARPAPAAPAPERRPAVTPLVWLAGFAAGLAILLAGVWRLTQLATGGRRVEDGRWLALSRSIAASYGLRRDVLLLQTDAPFLLATWGLRPARVLLPPQALEWTDDRIRVVLCHELAHVARADWLTQIGVQIVLAALWFNPLAWMASRLLRRESELACDDAVLDRGVGAADYAGHLVALARTFRRPSWSAWLPALAMARPSAFERRIAAMLNPRLDRRPLSQRTAAVLAALVIAVTAAAAAVQAVQAPPGALSGTVYDTTGGVMPGVAVTLEDAAQGKTEVVTDSSGRFAFPSIGRGRYVLSASLPGFRPMRDEFDLSAAADWDRAVTLQVGDLRETITVRERRIPTVVGPSSAPPKVIRVRVGGNIRAPRKTLDVRPVYPVSMRAAGREGQVPMEAVISADGSVSYVRVLSAQVHPDFAIAAVDAVRQWRFTPTLLNGQPVEVVMTVSVQFGLTN